MKLSTPLWYLVSAAVLLTLSCSGPMFSEGERIAVVETVRSEIEQSFPFFADSPFAEGEPEGYGWPTSSNFSQAIGEVDTAAESRSFRKQLVEAVASLNDGHTSIQLYYYGAYPGIQVRYIEGSGYFIERLSDRYKEAGLAVGDEILGVAGIDDENRTSWTSELNNEEYYADEVYTYIPASNMTSRRQYAANSLIAYALQEHGPHDRIGFEILKKDSIDKEFIEVQKGLRSEYFSRAGEPYAKWIYDRFYYIALPTMGYLDDIDRLDRLINEGMEAEGMILDLRRNGGGSSAVGDYLISRFGLQKEFHFTITGGGKNQDIGPVPPRGEQFEGPVAVLTDHYVFSAANHFVALCSYANSIEAREHPFTFIGGTTGGGSGIPEITRLTPEISLRMSTTVVVDPDGKHYERGIEPDIDIASGFTSAHLQDGKRLIPPEKGSFSEDIEQDVVTEAALNYLEGM